jgi:hypothetical protein
MHGVAILKEPVFNLDGTILVDKDIPGIVTAYLPDMERFAVQFPNKWLTFIETEEEFLKRVEYIKNEQ